jgi:hypothetical protein
MEKKQQTMGNCNICDKELSQEETNRAEYTDLIITCAEHNKYRDYSNLEVPKMELGIIKEYSAKWKKCEICECDLTQEDIASFSKHTTQPTCKKHRLANNWWQLDISKDWFEYCDYVGFDLNYSEQNQPKFHEWRIKKNTKN